MLKNKRIYIILLFIGLIIICAWGYVHIYISQLNTKKVLEDQLYNYQKILCKKKFILTEEKIINGVYNKSEHFFLKAKTESEASIKLQEILSSITQGLNLSIDRIEVPRIFKDKNEVKFIGMRIYFTSNAISFLHLIYNIESYKKPYLIINDLNFSKIKIYKNKQTSYRLKGSIFIKSLVKIGE